MFSITSLLDKKKIEYKRIGEEHFFDCPICGREKHFYYNVKKDLCLCQRCKWEGNRVGFLISGLGYSRKEAMALIKSEESLNFADLHSRITSMLTSKTKVDFFIEPIYFKIPLPDRILSVTKKNFPKAVAERGINWKLANALHLYTSVASHGRFFNRIIVPVETLKSKCFVGITAFTREKAKKVKEAQRKRGLEFRKSLFPKGSIMSEMLYLYNRVAHRKNRLFVVEGVWDVCSLLRLREFATCTFGDKVSKSQALLLANTEAESIYLMLDGDVPLKRLRKYYELLRLICFDKKVYMCRLPEEKDPDDLAEDELREVINAAEKRGYSLWTVGK